MTALVEIWGEFSKVSKKQQIAVSSSNLKSASCGFVSTSQQRGGEELKGKKMMRRSLTLTKSEATICMLLMDRFAPS